MTIFQVFFLDVCTTHRGNHGFRRFFVQLIAETMTLLVALYNSIAEIPLAKTAGRQSELQSCQNLQYDIYIHGNYSTIGVSLLDRSTDRRKENSKAAPKGGF